MERNATNRTKSSRAAAGPNAALRHGPLRLTLGSQLDVHFQAPQEEQDEHLKQEAPAWQSNQLGTNS